MKSEIDEMNFGATETREEKLTRSFGSRTVKLGDIPVKKPSAAAITILRRAGNRFLSFTQADIERIWPNGLDHEACVKAGLEYVNQDALFELEPDVMQWAVISQAGTDDIRAWYQDGAAFKNAVADAAMAAEYDVAQIEEAFVAVFDILAEINRAQVKPAPKKKTKGARGQTKKKAQRRRSS